MKRLSAGSTQCWSFLLFFLLFFLNFDIHNAIFNQTGSGLHSFDRHTKLVDIFELLNSINHHTFIQETIRNEYMTSFKVVNKIYYQYQSLISYSEHVEAEARLHLPGIQQLVTSLQKSASPQSQTSQGSSIPLSQTD